MTTPHFSILIDSQCPLCQKEARLLRRLDKGRGRLKIIDISSPDYDPATTGITYDQAMKEIHGITPDATIVTGMEVFRHAYTATGWGWLWAPTAWPILRPICDAAYRFFAKHRLKITRRTNACESDRCAPRTNNETQNAQRRPENRSASYTSGRNRT